MAKNSKIEWTHHTFNPWWGCTKVSAACKNCYAEAWAKRVGQNLWGGRANRRFFTEQHWQQPYSWNRQAEQDRERHRVFCASMADVFEPRRELDEWRERLWSVIEYTPNLDWLLLTKRPERVLSMVPWDSEWPDNVWIGATVESQRWVERIDHLKEIPATVRFLSCEPLLGEIELRPWLDSESSGYQVDWVICGGESGPKARPMNPAWARYVRDQCVEYGVPFHFKQWGNWSPNTPVSKYPTYREVQEGNGDKTFLYYSRKNRAGRELDKKTWDEIPLFD